MQGLEIALKLFLVTHEHLVGTGPNVQLPTAALDSKHISDYMFYEE